MNQRFVTTALVGALSAVLLAGCGSTKVFKADPRKPVKLTKIETPVAVLSPVFSTKLEQSSSLLKRKKANSKDVADLQVAPTTDGLIAASRSGVVTRYVGSSALWSINLSEVISSAVAIDTQEQIAIVGTRSGKIIALDVKTGATLWERALPSSSLAPALVQANKALVVTNSGVVYALDTATGALAWQYSIQSPAVTVRGMAKPLSLDARTAIIGASDGRVHALEVQSGTPVWVHRVGLASGVGDVARLRDVDDTPVLAAPYLYATSYSGQLAGFDMRTGQEVFVGKLASTKSVAVIGSLLVGSSIDGEVIGFNRANGEKLWTSEALKFRNLTNVAAVGQYAAVGDKEGVIHLFDQAGQIVSRVEAKGQITSLQVHQNRLYAQTADGIVTAWQF